MILTVDIGNSTIVFGLFSEQGELLFRSALESDRSRTADQWAIDLSGVFNLYGKAPRQVTGAIMSSVVPPVTGTMLHALEKVTGQRAMLVSQAMDTGLRMVNDIENQLGSDIIANSVSAIAKYEAPMILIDMGTATTISLIEHGGIYQGVLIVPGMGTMLNALSQKAAQLPFISIDMPEAPPILGRNTEDAMRGGLLYGNAGLLDGIIDRLEAQHGKVATIVATGGNARFVVKYCRHEIVNDHHLLLEGLYQLYCRNISGGLTGESETI